MKISINVGLILLNVGLFFFCLQLYRKNRRLKRKIVRLEEETREILERKIVKESPKDLVSIQKISDVSSNKTSSSISKEIGKEEIGKKEKEQSFVQVKEKERITGQDNKKEVGISKTDVKEEKNRFVSSGERDYQKVVPSKEKTEKKAYQKNVFQNKKTVTSPISISNQDSFNMNKLSFDLNEFIKKSEKIVPKIKESASKKDYLKAISDQMAEELKPQTIELTDYEKEQEEHAIISYQELLAVKDKIAMIDDEDETIDFIEELKNFRNSLD